RVVLRQNEHVLPERAVAAIAVPRLPELVAVSLVPVTARARAIRRLQRGRRVDPRGRDELLPVPLPLLQVELAEPGDVLRAHAQAVRPRVDSFGTLHPRRALDAERLEQ